MSISSLNIAFVGGGNMASAIIGGLLRQGLLANQIQVVEPWAEQRSKLQNELGINANAAPSASLASADLVVWAVKPQAFKEATEQTGPHTKNALHLSVAAGIRSDSIARWLACERVVRGMPNTPALIGKGITALFARAAVTKADRETVEQVIASTGEQLWVHKEELLDAVTALSGSGPAYVFYFIEAMARTGEAMGLPAAQAQRLAVSTFVGASALAEVSDETPEVLRARVTSKGGTTYAAISAMEQSKLSVLFASAMQAAKERAHELGDEFGAN